MSTLQMSQFACLVSSILSIVPTGSTLTSYIVSLPPFFSLFLFTNQPHTQQHQELTQGIYDTYMVCFLLIFYLLLKVMYINN